MRKDLLFQIILSCLVFSSCATMNKNYQSQNTINFSESPEVIHLIADSYEITKNYQKRFIAFDYMGKNHEFIIYDNNYLKMDGRIYAYKFKSLINYKLSLNIFGTETNIGGSEKVIGFEGVLTSIDNPESTYDFILAKDLFAKRHYRNKYEACKIPGIKFKGINIWYDGYIDSNGCWQSYSWSDYYEQVFGTVKQDIGRLLYMSLYRK